MPGSTFTSGMSKSSASWTTAPSVLASIDRANGLSTRTPMSASDIAVSSATSSDDQGSMGSGTYSPPSGARPSNSAVPSDAAGAEPRVETNRSAGAYLPFTAGLSYHLYFAITFDS